jgi:hypothetical protein
MPITSTTKSVYYVVFIWAVVVALVHPALSFRPRRMLVSMSGKGFGAPKKTDASNTASDILIKPTRPQEHRQVAGQYAKILAKISKQFEDIKPKFGVSRDIYARLSNSEVFWFVGKVNHMDGVATTEEAISALYILIQEYSKSLRPLELAKLRPTTSELQLWTAPGNTEMDVAKNAQSLQKFEPIDISAKLPALLESVGFEPEIYVNGEDGFRCKRNNDGTPLKPQFEVNIKTS